MGPRAPIYVFAARNLTVALRRKAALRPAALRACAKIALARNNDMTGVWGLWPQNLTLLTAFN